MNDPYKAEGPGANALPGSACPRGTSEPPPDATSVRTVRKRRRIDPHRRDRIADAALDVIAEHGVTGTSLRRIAAQADVPLGSLTYHFTDMQELIATAFERFVVRELDWLENRFRDIRDSAEASRELLAIIDEDASSPARALFLGSELHAFALRDPECRRIVREWTKGSVRVLRRHFDPGTAEILEVLAEGLTLRRFFCPTDASMSVAKDAFQRVLNPGFATPREHRD